MMKINSIEWHKRCLENRKNFLESKEKELIRLQDECGRIAKYYNFYKLQIGTAEKEGKVSFDSSKYLVTRK